MSLAANQSKGILAKTAKTWEEQSNLGDKSIGNEP